MILHPLMLAWLSGAAVPLVLHLLSRSQYRAVDWGAMMFLSGVHTGAQHAARLKQWTLLAVRMGMVGLLATALARPVIGSRYASVPTAGLTTGGSAAVVIILDDSAGMGYTSNGKSRLDLGREITLQILSALKRGDQASLLLVGTRDYQQLAVPSADLQSIASRVADLQPDIGQADYANDLTRAADVLEHSGPVDREIYLICDRQALGWRNVNDAFKQRWQARKSSGPLPRVTVLPVGGDESGNVAVEAIDLADRPVIRDQPNAINVRVRNYASAAVTDVPISVWTGTRTIKETTISVPGKSQRTFSFPYRFGEAGSKVVSAAIQSTGLTSDDRLDAAVDVIDHLKILVVTPDQALASTSPTTQPPAPLEVALAAADRRGSTPYQSSTISAARLSAETLKKIDVLILDNAQHFTPQQTQAMSHFVEAGGGLLVIPGDAGNADEYNKSLHSSGFGILPAMMKRPILKATTISTFDKQHPIFRFLSGRDLSAIVAVARYFPAVPYATEAHVLARFASGDPFLIDAAVAHGRVMLMTTPLNREWNSLLQSSLTDGLMQSIARYLGTNAAVDRNLWAGQPLVASTDEVVEDGSAFVQSLTAGEREPAIIMRAGNRTEMRYAKTGKPGTYRLRFKSDGKEKTFSFVVNAGRNGSDLTPVSQEQWKTLADRVGFERVDLSRITVANAIDNQRGGREIWIDLLGGVLVLMLVELMLSRWWST
jgi:hypothetical protein